MTSLRQDLHNHPGASGNEQYAHDRIVEHLRSLSPDALYTHVGGYGVVAYFAPGINTSTNQHPPVVALRADIDALPIGHCCGHDGHTATLLRVAELLSINRANNDLPTQYSLQHPTAGANNDLPTKYSPQHPTVGANHHLPITPDRGVILIFQPEEETGLGAQKIIDSGLLRSYDIRAVLAFHNIPGYTLGEVLLSDNTFAAASSGVIYHLKGRPTHASTPELGINPGSAVAEIIQRMQQLTHGDTSQRDRFAQATLIGVRLGDKAFGTSAGDADIMFTLRAFTNDTMQQLLNQAHRLVADIACRHKLTEHHELVEPFRATENTPQVVEQLRTLAVSRDCHVTMLPQPFRWSEDFSNYLLHYPGALLGIGAGERHLELHHPDYDFPDEIIEPTAQLLYTFAQNLSLTKEK